MVEIGISLGIILVAIVGGLLLWERLRGRAARRVDRLRRAGSMSAAVLLVAFVGIWFLSRSRWFQLFGGMVTRVETTAPVVALTFDDGPQPGETEEILEILAAEGVPGTFFVTGAELAQHPALGRRLVAAGHALGNHTYSHRRMVGVSYEFVHEEIERTDQLIRAAGYEGEIYVRAPNCRRWIVFPYYLMQHDRLMILWDSEPETGAPPDLSAEELAARAVKDVRPGSIVLLHVMYESRAVTRAAVPLIIRELRARGYRFVTVPELMSLESD